MNIRKYFWHVPVFEYPLNSRGLSLWEFWPTIFYHMSACSDFPTALLKYPNNILSWENSILGCYAVSTFLKYCPPSKRRSPFNSQQGLTSQKFGITSIAVRASFHDTVTCRLMFWYSLQYRGFKSFSLFQTLVYGHGNHRSAEMISF
jgi:hypothetical protein